MATIRRKNGKWHVQVRRKGCPSVSRSFLYKDWALRWAQETEREIDKGLVPASVSDLKGYLLKDLLERYLKEITPTKRGADSEEYRLRYLLRQPLPFLSLDRLTPQALSTYRDARLKMVSGSSVRRELAIIGHCLEIAATEWGVPLQRNPLKGLRLPSASPPRTRRLALGELERLLEEASKRVWYLVPIITFAIATGMRRGEILSLTWKNIDQDKSIALLRMTKNGHSRVVPLSPQALDVLTGVPSNSSKPFPVSPNGLRLAWERLCKAVEMEDLHFHDLRHEAISRFFEMGLTHPEVAQISGHRDARMLFRYAHASVSSINDHLRNADTINADKQSQI